MEAALAIVLIFVVIPGVIALVMGSIGGSPNDLGSTGLGDVAKAVLGVVMAPLVLVGLVALLSLVGVVVGLAVTGGMP